MHESKIITVGVKQLKDRLSSYLREIRMGTIVLVTDRGVVIAELRKPDHNRLKEDYCLERELVEAGQLIAPTQTQCDYSVSPVTLAPGTAERLLTEDRGL